ncbi:hypothetical protein EON65_11105 [archaeon]|nr:MAG: hypothetical protein EON65_11105 [archaeon]
MNVSYLQAYHSHLASNEGTRLSKTLVKPALLTWWWNSCLQNNPVIPSSSTAFSNRAREIVASVAPSRLCQNTCPADPAAPQSATN